MGKTLFNVIGITLRCCVFITGCSKSDTRSSKCNESKSELVEKEISKKRRLEVQTRPNYNVKLILVIALPKSNMLLMCKRDS